MDHTFKKEERLSSKKMIDCLFERTSSENQSFLVFPLKVIFRTEKYEQDEESKLPRILISVSKRNFKKAVSRNLIKRRLRESYRLNKQLTAPENKLYIAFIYVAREILDYQTIEKAMMASLRKISHLINEPKASL